MNNENIAFFNILKQDFITLRLRYNDIKSSSLFHNKMNLIYSDGITQI